MKRFLISKSTSTKSDAISETCDDFRLIDHFTASSETGVDIGWGNYESDIQQQKQTSAFGFKSPSVREKGWKKINGTKTYFTFRNGQYVSASGQEGMRLAIGDNVSKRTSASREISKPAITKSCVAPSLLPLEEPMSLGDSSDKSSKKRKTSDISLMFSESCKTSKK